MTQEAQLLLKNCGSREAAFRVLPNPLLKVSHQAGRIVMGSTFELKVRRTASA